jgi:hypothetical protein
MPPFALDLAIGLLSLGLFAAAYGGALLATRPARPPAGPAGPDLGEEPPAVVNLLSSRWRLTEDAAEATLLDLAARRIIEFRQPANDPMHTTIHLSEDQVSDLLPYERRVLDRVRGLAVGGVIPVTALTFRNQRQAYTWNRRLHREVVADAHTRGVSRRRFSAATVSVLIGFAALAAGGLFLAMLRYVLRNPSEDNDLGAAFAVGVMGFALLAGLVGRQRGERDTPAGRAAAARWLGVRDWLRGHPEFADLPPAAVAVWDRYLPYGAALGVTHTASQVLDLGLGDRRRVWSGYGGRWRRVRVRYPRFWGRYGRGVPSLLLAALLTVLVGGVLVRYHQEPAGLDGLVEGGDQWLVTAGRVMLVLGWLLVARGGYRLVRTVLDLMTTRTITGEVLWLEVWRTRSQGKDRPRVPWLHYLAVDDGSADRTTAWGLPHSTAGSRCRDGDTVTVRVRPWSRRVVDLTLVERGRAHQLAAAAAAEEPPGDQPDPAGLAGVAGLGGVAGLLGSVLGTGPPRVRAEALLTAAEVEQALGLAVREPEPHQMPGFAGAATFHTADRGRQVLLVQVADGTVGGWAWRANRRGTELAGLGDGAFQSGDRAVLRSGDFTLLLNLVRDARGRHSQLAWLLEQAAARLAPQPSDRHPAA